jgi:hypothetical protein
MSFIFIDMCAYPRNSVDIGDERRERLTPPETDEKRAANQNLTPTVEWESDCPA